MSEQAENADKHCFYYWMEKRGSYGINIISQICISLNGVSGGSVSVRESRVECIYHVLFIHVMGLCWVSPFSPFASLKIGGRRRD